MEPILEFAELRCGERKLADTETGELHTYFTLQIIGFPPARSDLPDQVALPQVVVHPNQFAELLQAIEDGLEKYFPGATRRRWSGSGSSGTTPSDLH